MGGSIAQLAAVASRPSVRPSVLAVGHHQCDERDARLWANKDSTDSVVLSDTQTTSDLVSFEDRFTVSFVEVDRSACRPRGNTRLGGCGVKIKTAQAWDVVWMM